MFRIDGTGGDEGILARLTEELELQGVSVEETRPALASLLSIAESSIDATRELAPQEQKRQTFAALRALMAAEAKSASRPRRFRGHPLGRPVDPRAARPPAYGRAHAARPHRHDREARVRAAMAGRDDVRKAEPGALEGNEVDELMAAVLGGGSLPKGVRAEVAERAAGVPLFIEETLKMILESGPGDAPGHTRHPPEPAHRPSRRASAT